MGMRPLTTGLLYPENAADQWNGVNLRQWFSKLVVSSGEREQGSKIGVGDEDLQNTVCKINS